jgi:peptidoglycan/LPS O-acetylase OafA/YrhL
VTAAASPAPSPAVAPPPGSPRFALFDALRAIAVLAVLAFHVCSVTGALNDRVVGDAVAVLGGQGPVLFFVISGFLLYRPFAAARAAQAPAPSAARYARRRVLRIVPAYWVALTVLAIAIGLAGVRSGDWWRYYLFLQVYSPETAISGIPVAWTLCVEVSFYALLPLWALAMRRVPSGRSWLRPELAGLAVVAFVGAAVQVAAARNAVSDVLATTILGQCVWLALGMALAVASVAAARGELSARIESVAARHAGLCWLGAFAAFAALTAVVHPGGLFGLVEARATPQPYAKTLGALGLGLALNVLVVAPAVFGEREGGFPRRVLATPVLVWIGVISYGMYLWHLPIVELLGLSSDPAHFSATGLGLAAKIHQLATPILFVLALAASAAVAALSYRFIELPFLRRKER